MLSSTYAQYEATRFTPDARRRVVWEEVLRFLERRFGVPDSFLDLGAGYCDAVRASRARVRFALDLRPELAQHAPPEVNVHVGSCADLSWLAGQHVDWVLASNLLEHLPKPMLDRTVAEIRQVLSPAGRLLVIQPNFRLCYRRYFDDFTHMPDAIMTDTSLPDYLMAAGYTVHEVHGRFLPFSLKSHLPAHRALVRAYLRSPVRPFAGQMLVVAGRHE